MPLVEDEKIPGSRSSTLPLLASVKPVKGAVLLFPQGVGGSAVDYARRNWPLHEGAPVVAGNPKYVIRSDALFVTKREQHCVGQREASVSDASIAGQFVSHCP